MSLLPERLLLVVGFLRLLLVSSCCLVRLASLRLAGTPEGLAQLLLDVDLFAQRRLAILLLSVAFGSGLVALTRRRRLAERGGKCVAHVALRGQQVSEAFDLYIVERA